MPAQINILDEITVDGFCGGGGWSTGFELAIGEPVTIAINHDASAIEMHRKNHPHTQHYNENIYAVNPREAVAGRNVGWAHFSPDCTHFSVAKGGKPVKKEIRSLAWVVVKWAGTVKPRIISMENVKEFMTWGPLIAKRDKETGRVLKTDGTVAEKGEVVPVWEQQLIPDPKRKGKTFRAFISEMKRLGYAVEWQVLRACDYGAPTSRERLFILFRRDGKPIVWPSPTHGDPHSEAVKIGKLMPWHTAAECIDWNEDITSIFDREKPLAENTLKRIARGIKRFIAENQEPFIIDYKFSNNSRTVGNPLSTITAVNDHYLVQPILAAPNLIQYHSETKGSTARGQTVNEPIQTIDTANRYGLTTAFLTKYYGGDKQNGADIQFPLPTATTKDRFGVVSAFIEKAYGGNYNGDGSNLKTPLPTITAVDHNRLVSAFIERQFGTSTGHKVTEPLATVTGVNKSRLVEVFLQKYDGGSNIIEIKGEKYQIVDICMRMLTPRELYNAQGFPKDYKIEWEMPNGKKYPKTQQVAKVGNSVPPAFATALVRANYPERCRNTAYATMADLEKNTCE